MDKLEKLCIKWLNDNYNPMEPFIMKEYPDYIFHMKNGQCILQYNKRNGYVYVNYREIWSFFERVFSMSNQQIKDVTKIWVEEYYKKGVTKTFNSELRWLFWVEEYYKKGVKTTDDDKYFQSWLVEEHYKEIQTSYFDPPYNPESVMASEITNQPVTDWPYNENFVNELYEQKTNG